ncbi:MAG: RdgB/HAM1 family non-canonical purine NTP pyrophosphatase [Alphaproteobacteria bacterium]|nr:RdgB/HAM1 family non-canonical purine NTP pyrophosphatase [Alphaproteobacteria bacterium]
MNASSRLLLGKIVIATHNAGKLHEMRELLEPYGIEALSAGELKLPEPDETGGDFIANALIKARSAAQLAQLPAFADDSGLCVEALGGEPGIHSARFAKDAGGFAQAMTKIDALMRACGNTSRRSQFVSALALVWPDGFEQTFEAKVHGDIVWPPRGERGFGYDPFFLPDGHDRTFGEMSSQEKHGVPADGSQALSHRARAFQMLARACLKKI